MNSPEPTESTTYTVYMLRCRDGSLYTGIAKDLTHRLKTHAAGTGAKYVARRLPFALVYSESQPDRSHALKREWQIKQLTKPEKEKLITGYCASGAPC